jgi:hypothetical protein
MNLENYLSKKLSKMSLIDMSAIKIIYFIFGLMCFSIYPKFNSLDWWVYLIFTIIPSFPLLVHFYGEKGSFKHKIKNYLLTNTMARQVLLLLSVLNFSFLLGISFPVLISFPIGFYLIAILVFSPVPFYDIWIKK